LGNTVSFKLGDYDHTQTLVIDPWTINPGFNTTNKAWDVEHDAVGNLYVYGAPMPHQLKKFNSAGALQWTYNTGFASYPGDLAVDQAGNSYITQSLNGICAKVNNAGGLTWSVNGPYREYWTISIDCSGSKLVIAESYPGTFMTNVNPTTGVSSGTTNVSPGGQDARAMCVAPNGNYYLITADYASNERLIGVTPAWATVLNVSAIHDPPYNATPLYNTNFIHGYNGITVNPNFIYSNRGSTLYKRNIITGAVVATAAIAGGANDANSGVAVDGCGNVYVGSQNAVIKYDSNLTVVSSQATPAVYDVTIGNLGEIYACGLGFVASLNFNACYPSLLTATASAINAGCGSGTGSASVSAVSGGTGPYTYSWNPSGGTNSTATGLSAGTYTVTITDATGCKFANKTVTISGGGGSLTLSSNQSINSCFGGSNGTATASSTTGTSPYTYSWNPTGQNTQTATGLSAGTYTVTVQDAAGCSSTIAVTLLQPSAITAGFSASTSVNCFGGNNGTATATATGGTGALTFTWNNGQVGANATGLSAGSYTVTANDANGCTQTASISIVQPTVLTATVNSSTTVSCFGGNNGTATAQGGGGTAGYTYSWNNGQATITATGLSAGTYTATVTDSKGCTQTATITITQPSALSLSTSTTLAACGGSNGTATVSASGGTAGYTYLWAFGSQATSTATGLSGGNYLVTVTDNKGCTKTISATVNNAGAPSVSISNSTNVSCFGGSNGSATASGSGGTGALTYSWAPSGGTGSTGTGMTAGTYTVSVTDVNGCTVVTTVAITQPVVVAAGISASVNVSCNGGNNGSATATATGGTGAMTFTWNNGQVAANATGLSAGTYTVTARDANGCTQTATVAITQPTIVTVGVSSNTMVSCFGGNNGTATATAKGGTGAMTFSWNNGQVTAAATGLSAGTYTVTATDANGCSKISTVTITQPAAVTLQTSTIGSTCSAANGSASVTANGGTGSYTYSWSNGQLTQTASGLLANTYTVTVTDNNGCSKTATVSVINSGSPFVSISAFTNVSCFGGNNGTATASAIGGSGAYTYTWITSGGNAANATGLIAGNYTVAVSDINGCTATATVTITEPAQLTIAATGTSVCQGTAASATSTAGGGTLGYTYLWSDGQTNATATNLTTGSYTLTLTDSKGCTASTSVQVTVNPKPLILMTASDTAGCSPLCVNFNCTTANITNYAWDFGDNNNNTSSLQNPLHCYKSSGSFDVTLTVTDGNGCTSTITKKAWIMVYPVPVADFSLSPQPTTVLNSTITFTDLSVGANTWSWVFGELSSGVNNTSVLQNPLHTYKDSGYYDVTLWVENAFGCKDSITKQLRILGDYVVYAPNAFTPNDDRLNDTWNVKGIGIDIEHFELYIFDRWGNLIYYTEDLNKGWNGHANHGKEIAQQDVYVWKVFTRDFLGGKHSYIGHLSLVR